MIGRYTNSNNSVRFCTTVPSSPLMCCAAAAVLRGCDIPYHLWSRVKLFTIIHLGTGLYAGSWHLLQLGVMCCTAPLVSSCQLHQLKALRVAHCRCQLNNGFILVPSHGMCQKYLHVQFRVATYIYSTAIMKQTLAAAVAASMPTSTCYWIASTLHIVLDTDDITILLPPLTLQLSQHSNCPLS